MKEIINFENKIVVYYPCIFEDKDCVEIKNYNPQEKLPFNIMNFWGVFKKLDQLEDTGILTIDITKVFSPTTSYLSYLNVLAAIQQKTILIKIYSSLEEFLKVDYYFVYQQVQKKNFFVGISFDSYNFILVYKKRYDFPEIEDCRISKAIPYDSYHFYKGFITVEIV